MATELIHTLTKNRRSIETSCDLLTPEQIETIRDAYLSDAFPTYLQNRNETIITVLADTGLHMSEHVEEGALSLSILGKRRNYDFGRAFIRLEYKPNLYLFEDFNRADQ